jgi:hypothetical protein
MLCGCGATGVGGLLDFVDLLLNIGKEGGSSIVANACS